MGVRIIQIPLQPGLRLKVAVCKKFCWLGFFFAMAASQGYAQEVIELDTELDFYRPNHSQIAHFVDPTNIDYADIDSKVFTAEVSSAEKAAYIEEYFDLLVSKGMGLEDILTQNVQADFVRGKEVNLGLQSNITWYKLKIFNPTSKPISLYLTLTGMISDVRIYAVDSKNQLISSSRTGVLYPSDYRSPFDFGNHLNAVLSIKENQDLTIYTAAYTIPGALNSQQLTLYSETGLIEKNYFWLVSQSLYYGSIFALLLYNFLLLLSSREKIYLHYVLYLTSFLGLISVLNGIYSGIFTESIIIHGKTFVELSFAGLFLFILLFSGSFLGLKSYKVFDRLNRVLAALIILQYGLSFILPFGITMLGFVLTNFLVFPFLIIVAIWLALQRKREAYLFLLAFLAFMIAALVQSFLALGIVERIPITENALQIGSFLEAILLSVAVGYKLRMLNIRVIKNLRELNKLEKLNTDIRIKALGDQLKPHFLFNSLSLIADQLRNSKHLAEESLMVLADVYRSILKGSKTSTWSLEDEISLVRDYLFIQKMRFAEKLLYTIDHEGVDSSIHCPCLIIQTLVENSVKHGILQIRSGGEIKVFITQEGGLYRVCVSNTASGDKSTIVQGTGSGLKNANERLGYLYGEKFQIDLKTEDAVTTAVFYITGEDFQR